MQSLDNSHSIGFLVASNEEQSNEAREKKRDLVRPATASWRLPGKQLGKINNLTKLEQGEKIISNVNPKNCYRSR